MSVTALHTAIRTAWSSALDTTFNSLWSAADRTRYPVLNDGEASPGQPFPYCVFVVSPGTTKARMTDEWTVRKEIWDVPVQFNVHARVIDGDARSAKQIASDMATAVMAVFGGHPTTAPTALTLANANHLLSQYDRDYGIRTGDDEYQWTVSVIMRLDMQLAA